WNKGEKERTPSHIIEDILSKPAVRPALLAHPSPLCALEELASKTFKGLEVSVLQAAEGRDGLTIFGQRQTPKKRRKSRTAFTNHQIYELEKRFLYQKYLSPADRDQIAQQLGLTNAQVITWFQNRRAKLKRDLEEMKADVESARKLEPTQLDKIAQLSEDLEQCVSEADSKSPALGSPPLPAAPSPARPHSHQQSSAEEEEDDEEEIDVDD
uniref:Ladybird homeobox 1a n=1 Tax=Callorhinchus milii TaxID=7868 RepID=A0A4W3IF62_CALMI